MNALTVVVPAYNEAQAVPTFLARLKEVLDSWGGRYEVIVVDDGSRDGTGAALAALAGSGWGRVITHERNRGYGESLKTGIANASHEEILITDADGTYDPGDIPKLLVLADDADMVVGARSGKGAQIPLVRRPAKWILRALANFLLETRIADLNSGLRALPQVSSDPVVRDPAARLLVHDDDHARVPLARPPRRVRADRLPSPFRHVEDPPHPRHAQLHRAHLEDGDLFPPAPCLRAALAPVSPERRRAARLLGHSRATRSRCPACSSS